MLLPLAKAILSRFRRQSTPGQVIEGKESGQRHGYGPMNDYFFWVCADYFCQHLIGDYATSVDILKLNREKGQVGNKAPRK